MVISLRPRSDSARLLRLTRLGFMKLRGVDDGDEAETGDGCADNSPVVLLSAVAVVVAAPPPPAPRDDGLVLAGFRKKERHRRTLFPHGW